MAINIPIPDFDVPGLKKYLEDLSRAIGQEVGLRPIQDRYQPYDANLQSLSSPFGLTAAGRELLDDADASAQLIGRPLGDPPEHLH